MSRTLTDDRKVGSYVRAVDPAMFTSISRIISSKSLGKIGAYVYLVDTDAYESALEEEQA